MRRTSGFICVVFFLLLCVSESKATSCSLIAKNLVANCGFETGDFTGWSLSGNDVPGALNNLYGVEGVDPFDGIPPNSGSFQAFFGDLVANSTTMQQTIATTISDMYEVSFFVAQDTAIAAPYSNAFSASFGGKTISMTGVPVEGYTEYSFVGTASSSSSTLSLTFGDDLGEFLVDDISVVQVVPEPPAWTLMLAGIMGSLLLWKSGVVSGTRRI